MADRALVAAIAAAGIPVEDAEDMLSRVTKAAQSLLLSGKTVRLDGIGALKAPVKLASAGFPPGHRIERKRVEIAGAVLWKGEPKPDTREKSKVTISRGAPR